MDLDNIFRITCKFNLLIYVSSRKFLLYHLEYSAELYFIRISWLTELADANFIDAQAKMGIFGQEYGLYNINTSN